MYENLFILDAKIQEAVTECAKFLIEAQRASAEKRKAALEKLQSAHASLRIEVETFKVQTEKASSHERIHELRERLQEHTMWVDELAHGIAEASLPNSRSAERILSSVLKTQKQALQSLFRSQEVMNESERSVHLSLDELARQKSVNATISSEIGHLQENTRQAGNEVRWFARNIVTDKLFVVIFCLTLLALLAVLGFKVYAVKRSRALSGDV